MAAAEERDKFNRGFAQALIAMLSSPGGLFSISSGIVCNFGAGGGGDGDKNELSNTNLVKFDDNSESDAGGLKLGVSINLVYTGDVSSYEKTEWIQSVTTNAFPSGEKPGKTYLDVGGEGDDRRAPFYYPKSVLEIVKIKEKNNGGVWFEDAPSRYTGQYLNRNYNFMAETTLIGYKNGSWSPIVTYGWGYSVINGNNILRTPINQTNWTTSNFNVIKLLNGQ